MDVFTIQKGDGHLHFKEEVVSSVEEFEIAEGNALRIKLSWQEPAKETWLGEDHVPQTTIWSSALPSRKSESFRLCGGSTGEENHVHVQCKHGFFLISGIRDISLTPFCLDANCKKSAEKWLKSQGLGSSLRGSATATGQQQHQGTWCSIGIAFQEMVNIDARLEGFRKLNTAHSLLKLWKEKESLLINLSCDASKMTTARGGNSENSQSTVISELLMLLDKSTELLFLDDREMAQANEAQLQSLMGCVSEMRGTLSELQHDDMLGMHQSEHGNAGRGGVTPGDVMGEVFIDKRQAEIFYFNAISALIKHRKGAMTKSQDAPDPWEQWMKQHGDIMVSVVKWMKVAFPDVESSQRMQKLEECIREVEHMGKPAPHCDHTVIDTHLAELPEMLKDTLRISLRNGIYTGITQPASTTSAKASKTALLSSMDADAKVRATRVGACLPS